MYSQVKRLRNILSSKHFRASLPIILSLVSLVYLCALGVLYSQLLTGLRQSTEAKANRIALAVQEQLSAVRTNAIFVGSVKTVERLMTMDEPDNSEIARMVGELGPFFNQSSYESVQVFFERSRRIYVSGVGMYSYDDYFDRELLSSLERIGRDELWRVGAYRRYFGESTPAVTYVRAAPLYSHQQDGFVSIVLPVARLQKTAQSAVSAMPAGVTVFFQEQLLFSLDTAFAGHYDPLLAYEENARSYFDGNPMIVHSTVETPVSVSCTVPVAPLLAGYLPLLGLIYLGLCLASFLCALLYSGAMLRSVDRILGKFGLPPETAEGGARPNEFEALGSAVDRLKGQMSSIQQTALRNMPLVQERLVHKIICSQVALAPGCEEYMEYGLTFPHPYFLVAIVSIPELSALSSHPDLEKLSLVVRREAEAALGTLGRGYSTYGENHTLLILVNTPCENIEEEVRERSREFCARLLSGFSLSPLISVGICTPGAPIPYQAYIQARRNLIYTYADQEEYLLFSRQNEYTPVVDEGLLNKLTQSIINRSSSELSEVVALFTRTYLGDGGDLRQAQRLCDICACTVYTRLLEMNLDAPEAPLEHCLQGIAAAQATDDCRSELHAYLLSLLNTEGKLPEKSQRYVHEAIAFIERHFSEDITVPQIAQASALNPIYLGKLFKLSTGKTLSEYLNCHRIEVSRRQLEESEQTVAAISKLVGYNDTRSYIRFFKKFHGVTPNEYRRQAEERR